MTRLAWFFTALFAVGCGEGSKSYDGDVSKQEDNNQNNEQKDSISGIEDSYDAALVVSGKTLYETQCEICHGSDGESGPYGAVFVQGSELSSADIYRKYLVDEMPYGAPAQCDADCSEAVFAYMVTEFYRDDNNSDDNSSNDDNNSDNNTDDNSNGLISPKNPLLNIDENQISFAWTASTDTVDGYEIERRINSDSWIVAGEMPANSTSFVETMTQWGAVYEYRVRAFVSVSAGKVKYSGYVTSIPQMSPEKLTAPAAPTNLLANISGFDIQLNWNDASDNEAGFTIERQQSGGQWSQIAIVTSNATTYTNLVVPVNVSLAYRVKAFNETGDSGYATVSKLLVEKSDDCEATNEISNASAPQYVAGTAYAAGEQVLNESSVYECVIAGWCSSASAFHYAPGTGQAWQDAWKLVGASDGKDSNSDTQCVEETVPAAPSNVQVFYNAESSRVLLSWSDQSDNESGYRIQRKVDSNDWMELIEIPVDQATHEDALIENGHQYQYRVAAFNVKGASDFVTSSLIEIPDLEPAPNKVASVQTMVDSVNKQIIVSWVDASENELGFKVERSVNEGDWTLVSQRPTNQTQYVDANLTVDSRYQYRVVAFNAAGNSDAVSSDSVTYIEAAENQENKNAFTTGCTACHNENNSVGGDLMDSRIAANWSGSSFNDFLTKVNTMNSGVFGCDTDCKAKAADYIWLDVWGYSKNVVVAADGRGVRGIRLLTPSEYQNAVSDLTGYSVNSDELPKAFFDSSFKYPTQSETGIVLYEKLSTLLTLAEKIAENANLISVGCSNAACSDAQVSEAGLRVLRRPLTASELSTYKTINNTQGSRGMLASMLLSPYFLYKSELGEWNDTEQAYELTDYEIASQLAFQLWGTTPTKALLTTAGSNQLSTPEQIRAAAIEMMSDAKFAENLVAYSKYYMHSHEVAVVKPGLSETLIVDMYEEQRAFVQYWIHSDTPEFDKLFDPGYTFLNQTLGEHYGLTATGTQMQKQDTDRNRGGLLHLGLTQIMNSDFAATSLVKRGKMIRENILCHTMGVPSGVDPDTIELPTNAITTRERWNVITGSDASNGQCWECHQLMNEPGSALEQFDQNGKFRTHELDYNGSNLSMLLDTTGTLRDNSANTLSNYSDTRELAQYLGQSDIARSCYVDSYYRFWSGQKKDDYVNEELDAIKTSFNQDDNVKNLILKFVESSMYRYRLDRG